MWMGVYMCVCVCACVHMYIRVCIWYSNRTLEATLNAKNKCYVHTHICIHMYALDYLLKI